MVCATPSSIDSRKALLVQGERRYSTRDGRGRAARGCRGVSDRHRGSSPARRRAHGATAVRRCARVLPARARPRCARLRGRLRVGLGAAGHGSGSRRDHRARACGRAAASAPRCPAEPRQGAVPDGPRRRGGRQLPCSARGERRLRPSLRPRHGDPRRPFRHARRRSRGAPRVRRERSALAALPLLPRNAARVPSASATSHRSSSRPTG